MKEILFLINRYVNNLTIDRGIVNTTSPYEEVRQVRVIFYFLLFLLFTFPIFIIVTYLADFKLITFVDTLSFITSIILFATYRKKSQTNLVANSIVAILFIDLLNAYISAGAGSNSGLVWIIVVPLIALPIRGIKASLFLTFLISLSTVAVNLLQMKLGRPLVEINEASQMYFLFLNTTLTPLALFLVALILHFSKEGLIIELREKREELELSNKNRRYLLSVLFHDLANSLVIIRNSSSHKLNEGRGEEKNLKNFERIHKASKNIEDLLVHVKKFQEQEKALCSVKLEAVSIKDCFDSVIFTFSEKLKVKKLSLETEIEDESIKVIAEKVALCNSILNNLISNAIKFSPPESTIKLNCQTRDGKVILRVSDSGIGIPNELRDIIFDVDEFTSRPGTDGEKGTGYGLPIVKRYIDLFGGSISFETQIDGEERGTTFEIELELA